jgi:hypothetical protein
MTQNRTSAATLVAVLAILGAGCEDGKFSVQGDTGDAQEGDGAETFDTGDNPPDMDPDSIDDADAIPDTGPDSDAVDMPVDTPVDTGPDIDLCTGSSLADYIMVTVVDTAPDTVARGYYRPSFVLSPLDDGTSKVAWNDGSGRAHITPLTAADSRAGTDIVVDASEVAGFAAHVEGGTLLVVRDDVMALHRVDGSGARVFDVQFVGDQPTDVVGNKWIDSWSDSGRLAWDGSRYAAYFGHTQLWDSGRHQGDMLRFVDGDGNVLGGGWDWGCSHSLEVLMGFTGSRDVPICLSDCYPTKGIHFSHRVAEISSEPSGNCLGSSAAQLGGLATVPGGFYHTFTSPEGRASSDVVLVHVDTSSGAVVGPKVYLTDTADEGERDAKLAWYGDHLLVAWTAGTSALFAVVTTGGEFLEGPVDIGQAYDGTSDFINFSNGDVGWVRGSGSQLEIVRLGICL